MRLILFSALSTGSPGLSKAAPLLAKKITIIRKTTEPNPISIVMKQLALLSFMILACILFIQGGGGAFSTSGEGLSLVKVEQAPISDASIEEGMDSFPRIDPQQAEQLVDAAVERFRYDIDVAQLAFENQINAAFEQAHSTLLSQLQTHVDEKVDRVALLRQTVRMAADIVSSDSRRAEMWMKQNFEDPLRPIIERLTQQISMARHQWVLDREAALSLLETNLLTDIPLQLEESAQASHLVGGEILGGVSQEGRLAATSLGLAAVTTGVFARSDVADLKKAPITLKKLSAKSVAKLSGTLNSRRFQKILGKRLMPIARGFAKKIAASGFLVVADGPLPIGDIVAIVVTGVSSVWTIYEVWNLGSGARDEIMEDAAANFASLETQIRVEVIEPVRSDHQALLKSVEPLRATLLTELSKL